MPKCECGRKTEKSNWMVYAAIKALCFHNVLSAINK